MLLEGLGDGEALRPGEGLDGVDLGFEAEAAARLALRRDPDIGDSVVLHGLPPSLKHPTDRRRMRSIPHALRVAATIIEHEATSASDNHGALTICLHAGDKPASVSTGFGLGGIKGGGGRSVDSLSQKSSS